MRTLTVTTEIDAAPSTVWRVLTAWTEYPLWNPFIPSLEGQLVVGSRLEARIAPPGGTAMTFRPTLTVVDDQRRLEWLGHLLLPGVFDGRHGFELQDVGAGRTRLTQSEVFSGLLVPLTGAMLRRTLEGFGLMNDAVRRRSEQAAGVRAESR